MIQDDDGDLLAPEDQGPEAIPRGAKSREKLEQSVDGLVAEFPDLPRDGLLILLAKLQQMPHFYRSRPNLKSEQWSVPKDLPKWKQTRAKLSQLERALNKAVSLMREGVEDDPAFTAALANAAPQVPLSTHYIALMTLHGAAQSAGAIEGIAGNRPVAKWTEKAADLCAFFWASRSGKRATPYFTSEEGKGTHPANDFSTWFCSVMKVIDPELTPSTCDTILRSNRSQNCPD